MLFRSDKPVDLGTIAAYDISPVMMNLYGLEQPLYFQLLNRQLQVADRANTRGTVMNLAGTTTQTPSSVSYTHLLQIIGAAKAGPVAQLNDLLCAQLPEFHRDPLPAVCLFHPMRQRSA